MADCPLMMVFRLLARRATGMLWASCAGASVGMEVRRLALVWIAVGLIGEAAAYVAAVQAVTVLAFSVWGGAIVDRWDARRALVLSDTGRSAVTLLLLAVMLAGLLDPWHLFAAAATLSTFSMIYEPALQVCVTRAASSNDALQALNGLMDGARRIARIAAPGVIAAIAAVLPVHHLLSISAGAHLVSAVAIVAAWPVLAQGLSEQSSSQPDRSMIGDLKAAIAMTARHPLMSYVVVTIAMRTACWVVTFYVCLPLRIEQAFGGGVGALGLVIALFGIGNLAGSAIAVTMRAWPPGITSALGRTLMGLGFLGMATTQDWSLLLAFGVLGAVGGPLGDLPSLGVLRSDFAADVVGKIVGLRSTADGVGMLLGMLAAPALIGIVGLSGTMALWAGLLTLAGSYGLWRFRPRRST